MFSLRFGGGGCVDFIFQIQRWVNGLGMVRVFYVFGYINSLQIGLRVNFVEKKKFVIDCQLKVGRKFVVIKGRYMEKVCLREKKINRKEMKE